MHWPHCLVSRSSKVGQAPECHCLLHCFRFLELSHVRCWFHFNLAQAKSRAVKQLMFNLARNSAFDIAKFVLVIDFWALELPACSIFPLPRTAFQS